jgi:FXSXX-COOH protein
LEEVSEQIRSSLVDLSGIDLDGLAAVDSPVLAASLQRLRDDIARPDQAIAAFQSSL